jgi:SAM-dependent methyltransferase
VTEARYDRIAATYAVGPDNYSVPATRALLDLTGAVVGAHVVDLACGHGLIAREMARRGASRVVGIDICGQLIARARAIEAGEPLGITYLEADVTSPVPPVDERFDAAVCNFGVSDIDDLDALFANVSRMLVPGGRFVFSMLHPCFPGVGDVSASWPSSGGYYDEGWWRADGERSLLRREVGANHRMLSTCVNLLAPNALVLDELAEPQPEQHWSRDRPGAAGLPVYLAARCVRRGPAR